MVATAMYPAVASSLGRMAELVSAETEFRTDQLGRFFELSADPFCIAGFDGHFKVLNKAWERTLGFSREELLATPWIEIVHPLDRQSTVAKTQEIGLHTSSFSFENRCRCTDGSYRWLLWKATTVPEQELIYATAHDITDRKQAEEALQQARAELETRVEERTLELAKSNAILLAEITHCRRMERSLWAAEEKYRSIFENAVEGIFQSTPDGTYLNVNPALARIKGYDSPEELIEDVEDIGQQSYVDPNRRVEFKSLMERDGVVTGFEYQVYRKDGRKIWLSMNARAVRNSEGSVVFYEGTIEDITERKQLEQQLRQAQKMEAVGQLAGGIAHDFNNLLSVITGHGELLMEKLEEHSPLRHHVQQIRRTGDSAASLVGQLLAFSRQQAVRPVVLDLNSVVTDVTEMLSSIIGANINLNTVLDFTLAPVKANRGQLERVLVNLIVNARDAMPNGGQLTIETANVSAGEARALSQSQSVSGPSVMLSVTDSGVGMDPETLSHIFEPFFTTKARGKGTGLGLATVYGAVKQSGGCVWVHSEPGAGTTFRVLLPRVDEPQEEMHLSDTVEPRQEGTETVLLVEDDPALRELIVSVLTKRGYTVREASNGLQAMSIARRSAGRIDLLLSDVVMPGLSGPRVADEVKSLHPDIKVLYMSGYADFAGDNAIEQRPLLAKPFTQRDLVRKIREVLTS